MALNRSFTQGGGWDDRSASLRMGFAQWMGRLVSAPSPYGVSGVCAGSGQGVTLVSENVGSED